MRTAVADTGLNIDGVPADVPGSRASGGLASDRLSRSRRLLSSVIGVALESSEWLPRNQPRC